VTARLAIFDIDGTLVTGAATERRFAMHLARSGRLGPRQALAFAAFAVGGLPAWGRHVLKKDKAWLAGLAAADVAALADAWAGPMLGRAACAPCCARLERHRQAGDRVALLSGTPQFIADAIGRALGADAVVGTLCAARDGRFRAAPPARHPFGAEKIALAAELARAAGTSLAQSVVYADSAHDLPLLRAAGTAVAVRPDAGLARAAAAAGWEILGTRRGADAGEPAEAPLARRG
jgi:HAD superfamily hydrolase (TIGR01490 family)